MGMMWVIAALWGLWQPALSPPSTDVLPRLDPTVIIFLCWAPWLQNRSGTIPLCGCGLGRARLSPAKGPSPGLLMAAGTSGTQGAACCLKLGGVMGSSGAVLLLKAAKPNVFVRVALGQDASSFSAGGAPLLRRRNLRGRHSLPSILYRWRCLGQQNTSTRPHIHAPNGPPAPRLPAGRVPLPDGRSVPSPLQGGVNPRDSARGAPRRDRGGITGHGMRGTGMATGRHREERDGTGLGVRGASTPGPCEPRVGTDSPARPRCRRLPEARARHNSRGPGPPPGTGTAAASMRAAASACPVPGARCPAAAAGRDGAGRGRLCLLLLPLPPAARKPTDGTPRGDLPACTLCGVSRSLQKGGSFATAEHLHAEPRVAVQGCGCQESGTSPGRPPGSSAPA